MSQKIKYLHIDSSLKIYGTTSNFVIQLQPAIFSLKSAKLIGLNLPITNYNINASNNIIYFSEQLA